jgi:PLD-like domain
VKAISSAQLVALLRAFLIVTSVSIAELLLPQLKVRADSIGGAEVLMTSPKCKAYRFGPNVECRNVEDWRTTYESNLPIAVKLRDALSNPDLRRVDVISFYLGDAFIDELVAAFPKSTADFFISSNTDSIQKLKAEFSQAGLTADFDAGVTLFELGAAGTFEDSDTYSFHPKIILLEYGEATSFTIVFTSDNFRLSPIFRTNTQKNYNTTNFENYNFLNSHASDTITKRHRCLFDVLHNRDPQSPLDLVQASSDYRFCVFSREAASQTSEKWRFYSLPFDLDGVLLDIGFQIGASDAIDIAAYNAGSDCLADTLLHAVSKGKIVRIITDDDMCGPQAADKDRAWYRKLEAAGVEIRVMPTNGNTFVSNLTHRFHHKFMIFKSSTDAMSVLTGSANFSCGGFGGNLESSYVIEDTQAVTDYELAFGNYWTDLSVSTDEAAQCDFN